MSSISYQIFCDSCIIYYIFLQKQQAIHFVIYIYYYLLFGMQKISKGSSSGLPSVHQRQGQISFSSNQNKTMSNQLPKRQEAQSQPQTRKFQLTFQKNKPSPYEIVNAKKQEPEKLVKIEEKPFNIIKKGKTEKTEPHHHHQKGKKTNISSSSSQNEVDDDEVSIHQQQVKPEDIKTKRISLLIQKQETKQFIELDCLVPDVYQSEVLLSRNGEDFTPNRANICGLQDIQFANFSIDIKGIRRIKIYPTVAKKKSFKIKISHVKDQINIGVQLRKQLNLLPQHYIWFAKIINARLVKDGVKLQCKHKNPNLYNEKVIFNQGFIYKCSKYRKKWEKRFVLINNQGLFSFKNPKENYTMSIPSANIEQLWTYFNIHDEHLIIKLMHNKEKTQFAIPILDYCLKQDHSNWLFSFYRLLMEHKIHIKI